MSYADSVSASRRLAILLTLYFSPRYTLHNTALRYKIEQIGYVTSADMMVSEIAWLTETKLIETLEPDVVRLTARGEDVALGRSQTEGVRRPSPGETDGPR